MRMLGQYVSYQRSLHLQFWVQAVLFVQIDIRHWCASAVHLPCPPNPDMPAQPTQLTQRDGDWHLGYAHRSKLKLVWWSVVWCIMSWYLTQKLFTGLWSQGRWSCTGSHLQFEFKRHSSKWNCPAGHCSALTNERAPVLSGLSNIPTLRA